MRRAPLALTLLFFLAACSSGSAPVRSEGASAQARVSSAAEAEALYSLPLHTLEGQPTTLGAYRGKALLVVNVASRCGLTPQYEQLEALQDRYSARGFTVVAFPCNQFLGQEPGSAEQIREFCQSKYGVSFPLMEKIEVNGPARHPLYALLASVKDADGKAGDVAWNFEKFVVAADGTTIERFRPRTEPDDPRVLAAIERALPH